MRVSAEALSSSALYDYNVRGYADKDTIRFNAALIQNSTINANMGDDFLTVEGASLNGTFVLGGKDNDILNVFQVSGGDDSDIIEVGNIEGEFLVNGNQGEDFITGIGNIVYRGGKDDDVIAVSQGEVYGDKGADTFVGVKGDGYAVIQDYTIGEDMIGINLDGAWDQIYGGSIFTDTSGDQILFLVGIDDVQQVETIDGSSLGNSGGSGGDSGNVTVGSSIGDGGGWLLL